jgi:hypothetical protein
VLFGLPALTGTAAVLLYCVIELWIPAVLGIAAFVQLRRLLRRETQAIKLCQPGDTIEIVGPRPGDHRSGRCEIDRQRHARTPGTRRTGS